MVERDMGGAIGELTLADSSLGALLAEMRDAVYEYGPATHQTEKRTTGQLADEMLAVGKAYPAVVSQELHDFLVKVKRLAEQRNKVVHAIGRDRCVVCGRSTQFEHRGAEVDRSGDRVRDLTAEIDRLITRGVSLAGALAQTLNAQLVANAEERARDTGKLQAPPQIAIGTLAHVCVDCSDDGNAGTTISVPAAVLIMPPGTDMKSLFGSDN